MGKAKKVKASSTQLIENAETDENTKYDEVETKSETKKAKNKKRKDVLGDTFDTNRPQAEEKDLEELLKDIESQYEENESKKSKRKKKGKAEQKGLLDKADQIPNENVTAIESNITKSKEDQIEGPVNESSQPKSKKQKGATSNKTEKKKTVKEKKESAVSEAISTHQAESSETTEHVKESKKGHKTEKKKGGLSSKQVELMKLAIAKQKELEEKFIREENERLLREEELIRRRKEQERQLKEKKQRKREKEKERIKKKKESGTYLSKEQKEKKDRALYQLQLAGVLPNADERVSTSLKPKNQKKTKKAKQDTGNEEEQEYITAEPSSLFEYKIVEEVKDDVKERWDESDDEIEEKLSTETEEAQKPLTEVNHRGSVETEVETEEDEDEEYSSGSETSTSDDEDDETLKDLMGVERARARIARRREIAKLNINPEDLRSPVICVLGHVDTGKTKMLDNLRRSHVQDGEAGGITQQIGATNIPRETIVERTKCCRTADKPVKIPGFLIIDTPGHESFKNLRSRGSSLCDIAILIVDIMHGLEPQTIESLQLLRSRRCPFVIALNKIDRLVGWESDPHCDIRTVIQRQRMHTIDDFERRYKSVILQMAERGLNAALYYQNSDPRSFYSMVPVSAVTGDGVGNLMSIIVDYCQTTLANRIAYSEELKCTVMEVKSIGGLGTTIDVCLVNGRLCEGDTIVVPGQEGPIVTQIRGLLMPAPNKELRVKNQYQLYKEIKGARGVKIAAKNLEKAMAGLPLYVAVKKDEIEVCEEEIKIQLKKAMSSFSVQEIGVYVQASTLGSLEALLDFLRASKIPYCGINIGPVHRKDIIKASVMLEKDSKWAVVLAFDVRVEKDAQELAESNGVKIFTADIIYHLFDKFMAYRDELKVQNQERFKNIAVFPCRLKMLPQFVFNSRDPIVVGVEVEEGFIKVNTPLCVIKENEGNTEVIDVGRIASIEANHKAVDIARKNSEVCIKVEAIPGEAPKMIGRHFEVTDILYSKISRESIDAVKEYFRDEMQKADWQLMIKLKELFQII